MRSNITPRSLDKLFKNDNWLDSLQNRCAILSSLNALVYQHLPPLLCVRCRVANYRKGILVLEVASASWLTRLRYEQEGLISHLRKNQLIGLASIQYKINPELNVETYVLQDNQLAVSRNLSQQSAERLLMLSQYASPRLKDSLIKLAKHATKSDNNA